MASEGIILGHKISSKGIEVDCSKIPNIEYLPPPISVKGVQSFPGHAGFYRRFIKDFSKNSKPISALLMNGWERFWGSELTRLEKEEKPNEKEVQIDDNFMGEQLSSIENEEKILWFADYVNYLVAKVVPLDMSRQQIKKFYSEVKHYYWDEPILFRQCADQIIRRCVLEEEIIFILTHCHNLHCGGYFGGTRTSTKVLQYFMGPFPSSYNNKYILLAVDYVSKWVEATTTPTCDGKEVLTFLHKNIFTRFGTLTTIISDRGSHFCNKSFTTLCACYEVHHQKALFYHPLANGQAEVSNREIKSILEKTVNTSWKDW
ncbi:uncharacterized protein LOC133814550 [Humulus lupulus]|uniref:uncharacterized protein LOC133814550 n=1 Tax=Humulus lupulus TaxID=3486 RepID=UPI002B41503C|nr:uncharacterized protein LOC133814550 [Humulus lupulus]